MPSIFVETQAGLLYRFAELAVCFVHGAAIHSMMIVSVDSVAGTRRLPNYFLAVGL